jgi:hypothetical protein
VPDRVAFCRLDDIGAPFVKSFATQWLARTRPCQRFTRGLATARAWLGVGVVCYSFTVVDFHLLSLAGLPTHPVDPFQQHR